MISIWKKKLDKIIYKRTTILKSVLKQLVCQKIFRTTDDQTAVLLQHSDTLQNKRLFEIAFLEN